MLETQETRVRSLGGEYPLVGGGDGNPLQYSCLKKSHGQRSLMGYGQWGHNESDTAEWVHTCAHTHMQVCTDSI